MSSQPFLGIDFGTCNSSMAWFNPKTGQAEILLNAEGEDKTPSVVWFGPKEVLVGKYAEERIEVAEDRKRVIVAVKLELAKRRVRMINGRAVTPVDAATEVLRKLKRDAEQLHFYQSVSRAVITHPAVFDEVEKDKLREAAKGAGFKEVELLAEPVAAALAYAAAGVKVGRHVLVYDLGGGTFDLALLVRDEDEGVFRLAMEPRGARLGGEDFDQAIYDFFDAQTQNKFGKPICEDGRDLRLLRQCRKYKENLSPIENPVPFSWWMSGMGRLKLQMKRKLFEELIDKQVEQSIQLARSLWEDALTFFCLRTESLILIGGSSRVPLIQRRLQEALAVEPRRWQKQDLAVTLGAAYHAQTRWGKGQPLKHIETTPPSESTAKQSNVPRGLPSARSKSAQSEPRIKKLGKSSIYNQRPAEVAKCDNPPRDAASTNVGIPSSSRYYPCPKCGFISIQDGKTCPSCGFRSNNNRRVNTDMLPSQVTTAPRKPLSQPPEYGIPPKQGVNNPTAFHPFKAFLICMVILVIVGVVFFPALAIVKPGLIAWYWFNWMNWSKHRR
jgi:actin-like ATPase involved in cell morphogenesis